MGRLFNSDFHDDFGIWPLAAFPTAVPISGKSGRWPRQWATAAEGAGDHCEMGNRSLLNRRVLDWLDDALAEAG